MSEYQTFIGYSFVINGDLQCNEDLIVEGQLYGGKINVGSNSFIVGKHSIVRGEVHARQVIVMGDFQGKIFAEDITIITSTGTVDAEIHTGKIEIADGAFYKGNLILKEPDRVKQTAS